MTHMTADEQTVSRGTGSEPAFRQLLRGKQKSKKALAFDPILDEYFQQITFKPRLTRGYVCVQLALGAMRNGHA